MLYFYSNSLNRNIPLDEVKGLSASELKTFHSELTDVVRSIEETINDSKEKERISGIMLSEDWLHRINMKKRVALKFAMEANSQLGGGSSLAQREEFERIYQSVFRKFLEREYGDEELRVIENEIHADARHEFMDWISKTGQKVWFRP